MNCSSCTTSWLMFLSGSYCLVTAGSGTVVDASCRALSGRGPVPERSRNSWDWIERLTHREIERTNAAERDRGRHHQVLATLSTTCTEQTEADAGTSERGCDAFCEMQDGMISSTRVQTNLELLLGLRLNGGAGPDEPEDGSRAADQNDSYMKLFADRLRKCLTVEGGG
jgi:hypothetical protein